MLVGPSEVLYTAPSLSFAEFEDLKKRVSGDVIRPPSPWMQTSRNQTCQTMIRVFQVELKVIVLAFENVLNFGASTKRMKSCGDSNARSLGSWSADLPPFRHSSGWASGTWTHSRSHLLQMLRPYLVGFTAFRSILVMRDHPISRSSKYPENEVINGN